MTRPLLLAAASLVLPAGAHGETPFPPHRIAGNLYYVGSVEYASYLVATPRGHILINPSFEESVPLIEAAVSRLGFRFSDIRILLTSHAHADHIAGCAAAVERSGARVMIMRGDEGVVASGGEGDFQYSSRYRPCKVARVLKDGDAVELGGAKLVARLTPGHTRGCTTWTMRVADGGAVLDAVIIGSPNVNSGYQLVGNAKYPRIADDFRRTFAVLKSLKCDLFLGAHGAYYGLEEKHRRLGKGANPFIDPEGYKAWVADRERLFLEKLAAQQADVKTRAPQAPDQRK